MFNKQHTYTSCDFLCEYYSLIKSLPPLTKKSPSFPGLSPKSQAYNGDGKVSFSLFPREKELWTKVIIPPPLIEYDTEAHWPKSIKQPTRWRRRGKEHPSLVRCQALCWVLFWTSLHSRFAPGQYCVIPSAKSCWGNWGLEKGQKTHLGLSGSKPKLPISKSSCLELPLETVHW